MHHIHRIGSALVLTLRLSKPIKTHYAKVDMVFWSQQILLSCLTFFLLKDHNLDVEKLMDSSPYKETYRRDMIVWSETIRDQDASYFCRLAVADANPACPVWLVCDARRESDMQFFREHHGRHLLTVRVHASEDVRQVRGWVYCKDVDDAPSECGLDNYLCDVTINNSSQSTLELALQLDQVTAWVRKMLTYTRVL